MTCVDEKHPFAKKPTRKEWDALVCYSELSDAQLCGDVGERKRKQRPSKEPSCWPKRNALFRWLERPRWVGFGFGQLMATSVLLFQALWI